MIMDINARLEKLEFDVGASLVVKKYCINQKNHLFSCNSSM